MIYHKPPELNWDPAVLSSRLVELGVNSSVKDQCVSIIVTVEARQPKKLPPSDDIKELDARRRLNAIVESLWHTGDFEIGISFKSDRFIRNVFVEHDVKLRADSVPQQIDQAMREHGFVRITRHFERAIARRFCSDVDAIQEFEDEIAQQEEIKMNCVRNKDFDGASWAREIQREVLGKLDSLVKNCAMDG